MQIVATKTLQELSPEQWNALNTDNNPFTSHEFLHGLEITGCVGGRTGWNPHYLIAYNDSPAPVAALPMYEKQHSWGEYVFDWAWANAWQRVGLAYYPKLVVAVPFSPVTGHRILIHESQDRHAATQAILEAAVNHAREANYSSIHVLFPTQAESVELRQQDFMIREDIQFHWQNHNYRDFGDFLSTMTSRKRKKIMRERRRVHEAGIRFRHLSGNQLDHAQADRIYQFYMSTIIAHNSTPYLNVDFFHHLVEQLGDHIVIIEACIGERVVAGALNVRHDGVLYGRYWGCVEDYHSLHFETCYYQAIDYCISQGMEYFEGGAQGEHKLSRGFLPVVTRSAHWLSEKKLVPAIRNFLDHEKQHVAHYQEILEHHSPFRDRN